VINDAGVPFTGHTEYLAAHTGAAHPVMLLAAESLRVALATTHLPLRAVSDAITPKLLDSTLRILADDVRRLWGIGPRMEERLMKAGIHTIGQLATQGEAVLERRFGTHGQDLLGLARGLDEREVHSQAAEAKSVGQEHTYDRDTADRAQHRRTLLRLCDGVARRLREQRLQCATVTLKHRDETFRTVTRATTLAAPTDRSDALFETAWGLLQGLPGPCKVRLLGVYASSFGAGRQLTLDLAKEPEKATADRVRDAVARRFGDGALTRASLLVYPERREGPRRRSDRR
jgi:DNA polymerase-4